MAPVATPPVQLTERSDRAKRSRNATNGGPIEQGITLRDALVTAAREANDLVRVLKRQKGQDRIVANTLASLKALQKVAG
jgi:hypothetical protein